MRQVFLTPYGQGAFSSGCLGSTPRAFRNVPAILAYYCISRRKESGFAKHLRAACLDVACKPLTVIRPFRFPRHISTNEIDSDYRLSQVVWIFSRRVGISSVRCRKSRGYGDVPPELLSFSLIPALFLLNGTVCANVQVAKADSAPGDQEACVGNARIPCIDRR